MCGLTGFINTSLSKDSCVAIIKNMCRVIRHRGPDDSGYWLSDHGHVVLGHQRLSIQDLSDAGHQPMISKNQRYVIVYNGEIYNFEELRVELLGLGHSFVGHSDTEVLLAAFSEWGVKASLSRFNGMFALALFDKEENKLYLARDRFGIKPLYYGYQQHTFLFGSEIKSFLLHLHFNKAIDFDALTLFMRYQCIPQPYSIYQGIKKLMPGTLLSLSLDNNQIQQQKFWDSQSEVGVEKSQLNEQELLKVLEEKLRRSVSYRMKADVEYGAFLSGGIDSSLIVALMQTLSSKSTKTFSIGFHSDKYNEAAFAKAVAKHLQTDHHELYVSQKDVQAIIPDLPKMFDEPFADSSQLPTYIVSQFAKQNVTVSLTGDGGDELFAGYHRHFMLNSLWNRIGNYPASIRKLIVKIFDRVSPNSWDEFLRRFPWIVPAKYQSNDYANKLQKLYACLKAGTIEDAYVDLVAQWRRAEDLVLNAAIPQHTVHDPQQYPELPQAIENLMYLDFVTYLQDDLLCKVDRTSMAVSLEARVPFLDHEFVKFAWSVPLQYKIRDGKGKYLLRQLLSQYVPLALIDRPKMGFSIPLEHWLRADLREWAGDLLSSSTIRQQGILNEGLITNVWQEHQSNRKNNHNLLWPILMFQTWYQHYFQATIPLSDHD